MTLQKYNSGFSVFDYAFFTPPPFYGKGWNITFENYEDSGRRKISSTVNGVENPSKTVVINANSLERAQYVSELIYAAECLHSGSLGLSPFYQGPEVHLIDSSFTSKQESLPNVSFSGIPLYCMIAAKASFRKEFQYALFKHLASHELISSDPWSFDPTEWVPGKFVSLSVGYHVKCAYAIVIAYSVIEELSFELRASKNNPSFIDSEWNPIVKNELEKRLKKAGINLAELFFWTLRDTPTKIERVRQPRIQNKANWSYGKIRDGEIEIIDALAQASWLRSKVSAHKLRELASALNYYEVHNIQWLARRLLLEKMGFWPIDKVYLENK